MSAAYYNPCSEFIVSWSISRGTTDIDTATPGAIPGKLGSGPLATTANRHTKQVQRIYSRPLPRGK